MENYSIRVENVFKHFEQKGSSSGMGGFGKKNKVKAVDGISMCVKPGEIIGIIGGTHLVKADEGRIRKSVDLLKTMDLEIIGLSHCTGENAAKVLKENYDDLFLNKTGTVLQL